MLSPQGSKNGDAERERRYFIAAGTARYANLPEEDQLPSVTADIQRMVALFTEMGYTHILPLLGNSPTSTELRQSVSQWIAHPDRLPTDILVFYYSGHGFSQGSKHYLLTSDSSINPATSSLTNSVGTALRAQVLGEMLEGSSLQHVLMILDTCYSGLGGSEIITAAQPLLDALDLPETPGAGFYALAAARSRQEAQQTVFSAAFDAVVRNPEPQYAGAHQPFLPLDDVVKALNTRLAAIAPYQQASLTAAGVNAPPRFLLNPHHARDIRLPVGIDMEAQERLLRRYRQERTAHWGPRGRGVESEAQAGWYFTGRVNALKELVSWLTAPQPDGKARVVTGDPGSGKSALLARLVTLSDAEYRSKIPLDNIPSEILPPESCIKIALHARQKTLEELTAALAAEAGIAETDPEMLVAALAERGTELTVVVDALDEAVDPTGVALRLLRPLTLVRCVKLLIGTRRPCIPSLGPAIVEIDLDKTEYIERADIAEYVQRRLLAADDAETRTPYRDQPDLARKVAKAVAERAFPLYLVARLISHDLMQAKKPVNPKDPTWRQSLPTSVGEAFEQFLTRFGPHEARVKALLRPLAYAEGNGLPWENLWAPLASEVAGKHYGDDDIDWLLSHAGAYIVEGVEAERSVYRLYHQALAEHLHRKGQDREIHRRFTEVLLKQTPTRNANGEKDWLRAHPYIQTHLAAHASAAGLMGSLTDDPLYLIVADPDRLLAALNTPGNNAGPTAFHTYQATFHQMKGAYTPQEEASYLEMTARKANLIPMAHAIAALPLKRPWSVEWGRWQRESPHRIIPGHESAVSSVALGEWQGRTVIVSGSYDSTVRVWDLATGTPIGEPLQGHDSLVNSVALGEWQGRTVIVSGSSDQTVRVWDLATGTPIGEPLQGHDDWVRSVALGEWQGRTVIVSGSDDQTVRVWDLATGTPIGEPLRGHDSLVNSVALGEWQGRTVIVSGNSDKTVRVWDLATGTPIGEPLQGHDNWVRSVALGEWQGRTVIVSGSDDQTVRVWDLATGTPIGEPLRGHNHWVRSVALGEWQGRTVIVSGSDDQTVRVWDLATGTPIGEPLRGHDNGVNSVALGEWQGRTVIVSGSDDQTVRVWDLATGTPIGEPLQGHDSLVSSVALGEWQGRTVIVSGSYDQTVRVWDLATGTPIGEPLQGHDSLVNSVALGEWQGRTVIVSGSSDQTVRVWDLATGTPIGEPLQGHDDWVRSVALGEWQGRTVIVSGSDDQTVRVWDLATGTPIGEPLRGHDHWVNSVALGEWQGRTVIVSGSSDKTVRVWDLATGTPIGEPLQGHDSLVNSVALGEWQGRTVIVSGSYDQTVRVWDLATGTPIGEPLRGHDNGVNSVALGEWQGRTVIVSGSNDQTVRLWRPGELYKLEIDLGANVSSVTITRNKQVVVGTSKGLIVLEIHSW